MICCLSLGSLGACKPKEVAQAPASTPAASAPATVAEAPAQPEAVSAAPPQQGAASPRAKEAPKVEAAAGGSGGIAGGWVNAGGACDSGAAVLFNPDGTYMAEGEKGTWSLNGKTLTVTTSSFDDPDTETVQGPEQSTGEAGEKSVLTVLSITDDAARVVLANGSNARWTRCTG